MKWKDQLLKKLEIDLKLDRTWVDYTDTLKENFPDIAIHLAIFSEPLLNKLLEGVKTVESRFSTNKISPFGKVRSGDLVVVKKSGGPVVAVFIASSVKNYSNLTTEKVKLLRDEFSDMLGLSAKDPFWIEKANSKYATFIKVKKLLPIVPFEVHKKDRTGWVIVKTRTDNKMFK